MVRVAGCLACLAMLLAMPGLRALCADTCPPESSPPESRTDEPPCHDEHGGQRQPPGDPPGACAHGDAPSSRAARPALDSAADAGLTPVPHFLPHGRPAVERHPAAAGGPSAAAFAVRTHLSPLRC